METKSSTPLSPPSEARIFVQIPSYRDPDCQWTIKDLFEQATRPERIFVGVLWQIVPEEDQDCFVVQTRPEQVRTEEVHARDSRGYSWACARVEQLWRGEEYTMRLDSHMRFEPGWDETLINMLSACGSSRAVLTTYPMGFAPPRELKGVGVVTKPVAKDFDANGILTFRSIINPEDKPPPMPMLTAFLAGGFYFAPSATLEAVPWDPHLYFFGTEVSMAVRLWTHGYDLYAPNRSILYHNYERVGRRLHWQDDKHWGVINARSHARVRHLFGTERTSDAAALAEIDKYGFGAARSLREYERFTDISFRNRRVSDRAKSYHFPYASREEAREALLSVGKRALTAGAPGRAVAQLKSGFTLSTRFNVPGVPAHLLEGNARPTNRRLIERQMQGVAVDLMYGATHESLIERLKALGAPDAEARRIIETGEKDPLIANGRETALMLRRRDWLLESLERLHALSPRAKFVERRTDLSGGEFLELYYARNRPVILQDEMVAWPARAKWTPSYIRAAAGLLPGGGERFTAADQEVVEVLMNSDVFAPLAHDLGRLDKILDRSAPPTGGVLRIAKSGALAPMHAEPRNQLLALFMGRCRVKLAAPADAARIYSRDGKNSEIVDFDAEKPDKARFPLAASVRFYDIDLEPGEILFLPMAWWHQIRTLEFGITASLVNFRWPNDFDRNFPKQVGPRMS